MYWSTKKIFGKIGAPLVQKCSALPEYSQLSSSYHIPKYEQPDSSLPILQSSNLDKNNILHKTSYDEI